MGLLEDQRFAARVQLGAAGEAIGQLEALVAQYPLREALWYWLMTALYRAGRQADALAAYAKVRKTLVEELGIEPGRELQELSTNPCAESRIWTATCRRGPGNAGCGSDREFAAGVVMPPDRPVCRSCCRRSTGP